MSEREDEELRLIVEARKKGWRTVLKEKNLVVSTIWRQCSAAFYNGWYYETQVWSTNPVTGELLEIQYTGQGGFNTHIDLVTRCERGEALEGEGDE